MKSAVDGEDSFLALLSAGERAADPVENEGFAVVGARHGCETFTEELISAEPVEDEPGVPSPATFSQIIEVCHVSNLDSGPY